MLLLLFSFFFNFCFRLIDFKVNVKYFSGNQSSYSFSLNGKEYTVKFGELDKQNRVYQCDVNGHRVKLSYFKDNETQMYNCFVNDKLYEFKLEDPKYVKELSSSSSSVSDINDSVAPMPGLVDRIFVKVGDKVKKGDPLVVMIAMKMEYVIKSARDGVVKSLYCSPGQNVKKSTKLVTLSD
jgi:3-methylcrotonyl-CoA carboxylase alpha subunit